jgi:vacuolar-type H+-ATPase subunit I/STV1
MPSLTKKLELETRLSQVTVLRKACSNEAIQFFDIMNKLELLRAGQLTDSKGKTHNSFEFRLASGTVKAVNNRGQLSMVRTTKQGPVPFSQLEMSHEVHRIMVQFRELETEISSVLTEYNELEKEFQSMDKSISEAQEFQRKRLSFDEEMREIRSDNITMNERLIQERKIFDLERLKHKNAVKRLSSNRVILKLGLFLLVSVSYNILSILHIV